MEQHYKFNPGDYNEHGTNLKNGNFFLDLIREWEIDFYDRYSPFFANCLFANVSVMIIIKNCLVTEPNEDCGWELINGEIDLDTTLKIGQHSKRPTIYGLSSNLDEDEPLYLIIDDSMVDGMVILKYVPESDEEDVSPEIPMETEKISKVH